MATSNQRILVNTHELSPTQATIGRFEVLLKADRFKLMSARDLDGYVVEKREKGKAIEVVKGPRRFFVIDGHHTLAAVLAADAARELELDLTADLSDLPEEAFWETMRDNRWLLLNAAGRAIEPRELPVGLEDLQDDPFRSIAWLIRKMGAFKDLKEPYQEFVIADFLRENMGFAPRAFHEYETASLRAFELMRSEAAKERSENEPLFGFIDEEYESEELVDAYYSVLEKVRAPRHYGR